MQGKFKQGKVYHSFLYIVWKETTHNLEKLQQQRLFLQCVLLVELASMNVFYSLWQLGDIYFYNSLSLLWDYFDCLECALGRQDHAPYFLPSLPSFN